MKVSMSYSQGQKKPLIQSACKELDALMELLGRKTLEPRELHYLHRMGYEIQYVGNLKAAYDYVGKVNVDSDNKLKKEFFEKKEDK